MTDSTLIIRWDDGEFDFLTEGGWFDYTEPGGPGEELVGGLSLVAIPYECGICGYPEYAYSESIPRADPPYAEPQGECRNCWELHSFDVTFDHAWPGLDRLRFLQLRAITDAIPLRISDSDHAKERLRGYP